MSVYQTKVSVLVKFCQFLRTLISIEIGVSWKCQFFRHFCFTVKCKSLSWTKTAEDDLNWDWSIWLEFGLEYCPVLLINGSYHCTEVMTDRGNVWKTDIFTKRLFQLKSMFWETDKISLKLTPMSDKLTLNSYLQF